LSRQRPVKRRALLFLNPTPESVTFIDFFLILPQVLNWTVEYPFKERQNLAAIRFAQRQIFAACRFDN
jgi:hypothetical protein